MSEAEVTKDLQSNFFKSLAAFGALLVLISFTKNQNGIILPEYWPAEAYAAIGHLGVFLLLVYIVRSFAKKNRPLQYIAVAAATIVLYLTCVLAIWAQGPPETGNHATTLSQLEKNLEEITFRRDPELIDASLQFFTPEASVLLNTGNSLINQGSAKTFLLSISGIRTNGDSRPWKFQIAGAEWEDEKIKSLIIRQE
ncbi:MAG: hypothetical protein HUU01_11010 [Saprospiraceae bacterium]|nr:hypothetical protein [Saprospiraceae bacterium]